MNYFQLILGVLRLLNFISSRVVMKDAERVVIAYELKKLNQALKITREIVDEVNKLPIDEVDRELNA